jgi:hypothetical protein
MLSRLRQRAPAGRSVRIEELHHLEEYKRVLVMHEGPDMYACVQYVGGLDIYRSGGLSVRPAVTYNQKTIRSGGFKFSSASKIKIKAYLHI